MTSAPDPRQAQGGGGYGPPGGPGGYGPPGGGPGGYGPPGGPGGYGPPGGPGAPGAPGGYGPPGAPGGYGPPGYPPPGGYGPPAPPYGAPFPPPTGGPPFGPPVSPQQAELKKKAQTWLIISAVSFVVCGSCFGVIGAVLCYMAMQAADQGNLTDGENKLKWGKIISIVGFAIGIVLSVVFGAIWIAGLIAAQ